VAIRKKILVVAGNISHLDQFVIHGFFKELSGSATVYLTLPEEDLATERWAEVAKILNDSITEVIPYEYRNVARKSGSQIGEASTFRFRKFSTGYSTRLRNKFLIGLGIPVNWKTKSGLREVWKNRGEVIRRTVKEFPSVVRGMKIFFWLWSRVVLKRILKNCQLPQVISELNSDATLILMQRQAGFVVSAIEGSASLAIPSLLLPIKWDNASSKSPLIRTPSRMLVYNMQVGAVCSRLHRMTQKSIVPVGSVEIGRGKFAKNFGPVRSVVLIGSTADAASSEPWLDLVSAIVARFESENPEIRANLVWRPYPTADKKSLVFMERFLEKQDAIVLDEDIRFGISHRSKQTAFSGVVSAYLRYCNLLDNSSLVVSESTSAIVDSRARGIPVIVPAFKKDAVIGSQWYLVNGFEHSQGLKTTTGVFIAEDEQELERLLVDFLKNPRRIPPDNSGENIFVDERSYAQRVLDVVDEVIAEKSAKAG
jgi:hypothetical protein